MKERTRQTLRQIRIRATALLIICAMAVTSMSSFAGMDVFAATSGTCGKDLTWNLDTETGVLIISGDGVLENSPSFRLIPWYDYRKSIKKVEFNGNITHIGDYAFYGCSNLTSINIPSSVGTFGWWSFAYSGLVDITIPNTVSNIGKYTFYKCSNLTNINIPNSVKTIQECEFYGCSSLINISIPNSVTYIAGNAFQYCSSLVEITIPDSVETIGEQVFYKCTSLKEAIIGNSVESISDSAFWECSSLRNVIIGDSVKSIGSNAFSGCSSLTNINVNKSNEVFASLDGVFFNKAITTLIIYPRGKEGDYTIPSSVTSIGSDAFLSCIRLTNITIPNSVTSIGDQAFDGCSSLTNIIIPDSVTSIGDQAFYNCGSLTNITIPDSVISIGDFSFDGCNGLTSAGPIGSGCNYEFGWTQSIPDYAFSMCSSLTSITIPDSVTSIGSGAFASCRSLTSITLPNAVTSIGSSAFASCRSLTSITIPDTVTSIDVATFKSCGSLKSIVIPNTVTSILANAFRGCSSLTSITIPNSVTSIGWSAFYGCSSLTDVYYTGSEEDWANISIGSDNECLTNATIHYNSTGENEEEVIDTHSYKAVYKNSDAVKVTKPVDHTDAKEYKIGKDSKQIYEELEDENTSSKFNDLTVSGGTVEINGQVECKNLKITHGGIVTVNGTGLLKVNDTISVEGGALLGSGSLYVDGEIDCDNLNIKYGGVYARGGNLVADEIKITGGGYLSQNSGNVVAKSLFYSNCNEVNKLTGGKLWIGSEFKQANNKDNFQASDSHSTVFYNTTNATKVKFKKSAKGKSYFNNVYRAQNSTVYTDNDLDDFIKGQYGYAKINISKYSCEPNGITLSKQAEYEKNLITSLQTDCSVGFTDTSLGSYITNKNERKAILEMISKWAVISGSPISTEMLTNKGDIKNKILVLDIQLSNNRDIKAVLDLAQYGSSGNFGQVSFYSDKFGISYEDRKFLGMLTSTDIAAFKYSVVKYLGTEFKDELLKWYGKIALKALGYDEFIAELIDFIVQSYEFYDIEVKSYVTTNDKLKKSSSSGSAVMLSAVGTDTRSYVTATAVQSTNITEDTQEIMPLTANATAPASSGTSDSGEWFENANLENKIVKLLGLSSSDGITEEKLQTIEKLDISNSFITELDGIEKLVNLKELDFSDNLITDLTPISTLTKLEKINGGNVKKSV